MRWQVDKLRAELGRAKPPPPPQQPSGSRFGEFVHLKREVESLKAVNDELQRGKPQTPRDSTEFGLRDPTYALAPAALQPKAQPGFGRNNKPFGALAAAASAAANAPAAAAFGR
jgi:hypothetical protein